EEWKKDPDAIVHLFGIGKWLVENGYQISYYDYPGYDETVGKPLGKIGQAQRAMELYKYNHVVYVGFSASGDAALLAAYNAYRIINIVDKVILMDPGLCAEIPYLDGKATITREQFVRMAQELTSNGVEVKNASSRGNESYLDCKSVGVNVESYDADFHMDLNSDVSYFSEHLWK
ncbi:MAG: hypothetical protein LWX83_19225, partial [Anaerolineae bacterium]|nr:hypothetical protein [Anaerolineae bacterium]